LVLTNQKYWRPDLHLTEYDVQIGPFLLGAVTFCLSTNGLYLPLYAEELARKKVLQ
jgi:hypothetical protein